MTTHYLELDHSLGAHSANPDPACPICDPSVPRVPVSIPTFVAGPGSAPSLPDSLDFTYGPDRHQTISLEHRPEGIRITAWVTSASDPEQMEPLDDQAFESFFPTDATLNAALPCISCGKKVAWVEEGFGGLDTRAIEVEALPRVQSHCEGHRHGHAPSGFAPSYRVRPGTFDVPMDDRLVLNDEDGVYYYPTV